MLIAVPSDAPGGLDATIAEHFGHCDAFTLVHVEDGAPGPVRVLENGGHDHNGCMTPVSLLKAEGVDVLVSGGMGRRPLAGFQSVGIMVYAKAEARTVRDGIQLVLEERAEELGVEHSCAGGCSHDDEGDDDHAGHHHHHHHHPVVREPIAGRADVQAGRVVTFDYVLRDKDGTDLDSSAGGAPLRYLHGHGNIVPGLERALEGLEAGAKRVVEVAARDAYGERDQAKVFEVPREQLPADVEVGAMLRAQQSNGVPVVLTVVRLDGEQATLDANHPLAGKDLVFDVTLVAVEQATAEELEHGHVH